MCNKASTIHQYTNDSTNFVILCASLFIMFIITIAFKRFIYKRSTEFYKQTLSKRHVFVITDIKDFDVNFCQLRDLFANFKACGFDCLWSSSKERIYIISIAFPDGSCYVIHIQMPYRTEQLSFKKDFYSFVQLLEDPTILKIGLGIIGNARKLYADYNISLLGCIDLRNLAVRLRVSGVSSLQLGELSDSWLSYPYSKDNNYKLHHKPCQLSTIMLRKVTFKSLVTILCAVEFMCRKKDTNAYYVFNFVNQVKSYCVGIIDKPFSRKPLGFKNYIGTSDEIMIRTFDYPDGIALSKLVVKASVLVSSYENEMLGYCAPQIGNWLVNNKLAEFLSYNPKIIRLFFRLSGINTCESNFVSPFLNGPDLYGSPLVRCVVCYENENAYITRHIIPLTYRNNISNVSIHEKPTDIVNLCFKCHFIYSYTVRELQNIIAKELKCPFYPKDFITAQIYKQLTKAKNAARALLELDAKLSTQRTEELNNQIADCFGNVIISSFVNCGGRRSMMQPMRRKSSIVLNAPTNRYSLFKRISRRDSRKSFSELRSSYSMESCTSRAVNPLEACNSYIPKELLEAIADIKLLEGEFTGKKMHSRMCHGQNVVNWLQKNQSLDDFIAMWRQHFVDSMTPHFLPGNWPEICRYDRFAEMNFCAFNNEDPFVSLK